MRLTQVNCLPPRFHFWKEFGAGKKRRIPFYKHWSNTWKRHILPVKTPDFTLSLDQLPPGSTIIEAEDLLTGPITLMPHEILKRKKENFIYDHPWPFNVKLDPIKNQQPIYTYAIESRFFMPRQDCLVLTNTLLETDQMEASPAFEPTNEQVSTVERNFNWCTQGDSVLVRLPKRREWPKINLKPRAKYGITEERQELNVLKIMSDYSQTLLAKHYKDEGLNDKLTELLGRRHLIFPRCQVPFQRQCKKMNLILFIDTLTVSPKSLPQLESDIESTRQRAPITIKPRSWKSLLEQTRDYQPDWSFSLPSNVNLHTIQLAWRNKRVHFTGDEMLAKSIIHAFGLTSQYARLRSHQEVKGQTNILQDPLAVGIDENDSLVKPVVLQTISFDVTQRNFYFTRYQLNTLKFDDTNESRVKNQAWYSGPISDLDQALRFYLDFQASTG